MAVPHLVSPNSHAVWAVFLIVACVPVIAGLTARHAVYGLSGVVLGFWKLTTGGKPQPPQKGRSLAAVLGVLASAARGGCCVVMPVMTYLLLEDASEWLPWLRWVAVAQYDILSVVSYCVVAVVSDNGKPSRTAKRLNRIQRESNFLKTAVALMLLLVFRNTPNRSTALPVVSVIVEMLAVQSLCVSRLCGGKISVEASGLLQAAYSAINLFLVIHYHRW